MTPTKEMRAEKIQKLLIVYREFTDAKLLELQDSLKKHGTSSTKNAYDIVAKERNLKV